MKQIASKGFSMIEIVIVIVITGVIGSIAASILSQGSNIYISETNRQGFVSEARSSFWKIIRESQGQASSLDFSSSSQKNLILKNAKGETIDFLAESSGYLKRRFNNESYIVLSDFISYPESNFIYFDNDFNLITPSQNVLTSEQAEIVHLIKLDLKFSTNEDTLLLSSHIYPNNFRMGKTMSYHKYE